MKTCPKCKTPKPFNEFHKDARTIGGLCCWCKICQAAANRARLLRNPGKIRAIVQKSWMKRAYGLTVEEKEALVLLQGGRCAICSEPFPSSFHANIDHVHGSDPVIIRGILCPQCNVGLGNFKDSPERLFKAIGYLKKFQKST